MRLRALLPALVALAIGHSAAAQGKRPLALDDFYRVETASDPEISPDGRWVAFVRSAIIEADNARQTEIWLAPSDGSAPATRVTTPAFNASSPVWSPDGSLLAFTSRRRIPGVTDRASNVWFLRMDRPGGEAFQIGGVDGTPIFSPDNKWIAFTRETPPAHKAAAAMSDSEKKIQERFKGRIYDWMGYRFDQRGYLADPRDPAATPPKEIYVVSRSGGTPRQITALGVDVQSFSWRPDSQAIALVANEHQRDEYQYDRADVFVIPFDAGGDRRATLQTAERITNDGNDHDSVQWSADGQSLVFRRQVGLDKVIASKQDHGAAVDVVRVSLARSSRTIQNLTADWDYLPGAPMASTEAVFFSGGIGGNDHLFKVPLAGGTVQQITRGDRQLGGFSASDKFDRWAFTLTDVTHPSEVYTVNAAGQDEHRLSAFNDKLVAEVTLQPTTRILAKSKDGTEIEGWVVMPPTGASSAKLPMILAMHGGPHGAYGNGFAFQFQLWAANGYAVVYANPRGSTNYGEKFLWATWGGWGNRDFDDVMAAVDEAIKRFPIDERRLGVTGYSYGGFLTDWVITHTSRFAAAVSGAGISNWVSDYGTADIPRTKESEFYGTPWESASLDLLIKQSPIVYAKNVTTPTMFVHGESDLRVPIEQAEQMYTALKKRKVPAKFIRYPEMFHGGWTPWNTVHRYHNELQWWGQYLGPRPTSSQ